MLGDMPFAYFCTVDRKGQPHITPMFFHFDEENDSIFLVTSAASHKTSNIHENPQVALTIDVRDPVNPFNNKGVLIQGVAEIKEPEEQGADAEVKKAYIGLVKKYPTFQVQSLYREEAKAHMTKQHLKEFNEVLIKVIPQKMVYWTKGPNFQVVRF